MVTKSNSKVLYFDLIGGISGDMTVGALLDIGVSFDFLKRELKKIRLRGYVLKKRSCERGHMRATKFDCIISENRNYSFNEIVRLIKSSTLAHGTKDKILKIFSVLAKAEVSVHGHSHGDIHFEQLGDLDTVIDIAAACICLDKMDAKTIIYSFVPLSQKIAPAVLELLGNKQIYFTDYAYENVTPTGAAILLGLGQQIKTKNGPIFTISRYGCGAGSLDPATNANALRVIELNAKDLYLESDDLLVVEANIDDMNPQFFEYVFEKLFETGAIDVFIESVVMKKSRPGFLLKVLISRENLGKISTLVLEETTTSGVRFYPVERLKLKREVRALNVGGRKARVKLMTLADGGLRIAPEYDDARALAVENNQSLLKTYDVIKRKAELKWHSPV